MEQLYFRPEIALDQFLPIFIVSTLVLLFGVGYAAIITLSKMGFFSKKWHPVGYLMWALQAYSLYELSVLIQSNHFTTEVLMVTMVAYLFIPHLYFYLIEESEKRYENSDSSTQQ
jgi:predicted MFS family arabinose efflux permease